MTEIEFEKAWDNYEFDSEYPEYIMEHCRGDRIICNGDTMIAAMEDGYLYEEFKNSKVKYTPRTKEHTMDTITVNGIEYVRKVCQTNDTRYDDLIQVIKSDLAMLRENARQAHKDFSDNEFTVNSIEQEGFLRGIVTVENFINEQIRWSQEDL